MLYQPRENPNALLLRIKTILKNFPEVTHAFYCRGSYFNDSEISEKNIIGVRIDYENNKGIPFNFLKATRLLEKEHKDTLFVSADDDNFSGYFGDISPFYELM